MGQGDLLFDHHDAFFGESLFGVVVDELTIDEPVVDTMCNNSFYLGFRSARLGSARDPPLIVLQRPLFCQHKDTVSRGPSRIYNFIGDQYFGVLQALWGVDCDHFC